MIQPGQVAWGSVVLTRNPIVFCRAPTRYNECVKSVAAFLICASLFAQTPVKVEYACPPEDLESFGMSCSGEDPCAVFLELSSIESIGGRWFAAGNLHTGSTTLYSVLLQSEDEGKTWTEPLKRMRAAALEQIQFLDFSDGWISGQVIEPLPKDPFLLLTTDAGKTWTQKPMFEESRFGAVAQFWFDSRTTGELVLDHRQSGGIRHEIYETNTGGESWEIKETTAKPVTLKMPKKEDARFRLRADGKAHHIEQRASSKWEPVASFLIHVADCK
jgi:hypothetical protein